MLLKNKVAIITGGGSGLGKEASLLFAKEGAKVVVVDWNLDKAEETIVDITKQGGTAIAMKVDVSNRKMVDSMVENTIKRFGKIDILINNAGITKDATLMKMTQDDWNKVIDINQTGVFNCTQAVAQHMINQQSGKIINTSSIVGKMGNFGQTNYAATKAAVIGMTQTWARELSRKGINVNAVAPGFIETPMTQAMPQKVLESMREKVFLKRLGSPKDIANTYLFLASEMSDYINGAVISVDGGLNI